MYLGFLCMHINFSIFPGIESKGNFFSSGAVGHACTLRAGLHSQVYSARINKQSAFHANHHWLLVSVAALVMFSGKYKINAFCIPWAFEGCNSCCCILFKDLAYGHDNFKNCCVTYHLSLAEWKFWSGLWSFYNMSTKSLKPVIFYYIFLRHNHFQI